MELFKINEQYEVEIDKAWILLIPEFNAIVKRDKGSEGDSEGRKKLKARKQLGYIYFMVDFKSPIWDWDGLEKQDEALRYTGLTEKEINDPIITAALEQYKKIQYKGSRALRSIEAVYRGLDAADDYFLTVDFTKTDKQGKLLHSPKEMITNISTMKKAYEDLSKFKQSVEDELKKNNTIRGQASLGDKETERRAIWVETSENTSPSMQAPNWGSLANSVQIKEQE